MKPSGLYCEECCSFDCECWYVAEIERLRKELADLEAATTPWRELQGMKRKIDTLEPVAWVHGKPDEPWDCLQWFPDEYSSVPLYDLRGIKE